MADGSTLDRLATEVGTALESLTPLTLSDDAFVEFVRTELGFDLPAGAAGLGLGPDSLRRVSAAFDDLGAVLDADDPDATAVAERVGALVFAVGVSAAQVATAAHRWAEGLDPAFATASKVVEELPRRLLDWFVVDQIEERRPALVDALRVLGILEVEPVAADPATFTTAHIRRTVRLDRLARLLSDPHRWWTETYGWGGAASDLESLLRRLFDLAVALGLPAELRGADLATASTLAGSPVVTTERDAPSWLRIPILTSLNTGLDLEAGLALVVLPPGSASGEGLALLPYADAGVSGEIPLDAQANWSFTLGATFDLQGGVGIVARPGQALTALADLDGAGSAVSGTLDAILARHVDAPPVGLVTFGDSGLFISGAHLRVAARIDTSGPPELVVEIGVDQAALRVRMGDGDGFLRKVVPDLDVTFDAGFGLSSIRGAYFTHDENAKTSRGSHPDSTASSPSGLTVPVHKSIGGVKVTRLTTKLITTDQDGGGVRLTMGADLELSLGPFAASVEDLGARLDLTRRPGGNLGAVDLQIGFKPPAGIGLAIQAAAISGGGFLEAEPEAGRYAGIFELTLMGSVAVKAIGIITTRLPDGGDGFALLILITAEGFTPIQLGMGFALTGIGGLVALNRTVDADAVRGGLRDGILDSVLFVKDPVKNADRVVAALDRVFPVARDRLVVGPLAEISWGTPTILTMRAALLLDLPMPVRAVILAALAVRLPRPEHPVVEIHVDAVGELDLAKGRLALDASLHDSRILTFTLTGDLALRLDWGADPGFLLAVGGFHPRFIPPPGVRPLRRLALQLTSGDDPQVRFETYLAITSNTLQLGARASVKLEVAGFGVEGGGSFDALLQWSPFHLEVDLAAWVKITADGTTLVSLSLELAVTGPQPWHLTGKAEFDILFFSVSVPVDVTLGSSPAAIDPVETVDVAGLIWEQVGAASSWQAVLPAGVTPGVTIVAGTPAADRVLTHPLARVSVRQKVIPLGRPITHVGARVPAGGVRAYDLTLTLPDGVIAGPLTDLFAPTQFTDVSGEDRLSAPSFAEMPSGWEIQPVDAHTSGPSISCLAVVDTLDVTDLDVAASPGDPAPALVPATTVPGVWS